MKKLRFGIPESAVPSRFCKGFHYYETKIQYPTEKIRWILKKEGCLLELPFDANEEYYGFGLQLKAVSFKGKKVTVRCNSDPVAATGDSHAPVPFFVCTAGYGVYVDTARYAEFGIGMQKSCIEVIPDQIQTDTQNLYVYRESGSSKVISVWIPCVQGVDIYIMEGHNLTDVVSQYNLMSGGGADIPEWGLGVYYRCCAKYNSKQVLDTARYFRKSNIPCQVIGLEPGWQSGAYPCTYIWDENRFPNHQVILRELSQMGYHVNLWEHAFVGKNSPVYQSLKKYSGDYAVFGGLVPDFSMEQAQEIFSEYHKSHLISDCVDGFKLDECDGSDFISFAWSFPNAASFPGGMGGEQYHNLFGVLYQQTILNALEKRKTFSAARASGALAASYPYALYSDLYDHEDYIRGIVSSGFSGLLWAPELRHASSKKDLIRRLQTAVFSAQCLINAWYCEEVPWKKWNCEDEVIRLLNIRGGLLPRLKKAFEEYHITGKPPIRALVCDYTADFHARGIFDEYILGDDMLVAPLTADSDSRSIYLPDGIWQNYFSISDIRSGGEFEFSGDDIAVYVKID